MPLLHVLLLSILLLHSSLAFQQDAWRVGVKPLIKARIDYRCVNKYMSENYGHQTRQPYFTASQAKQSVWNARNGVYDDLMKLWKPASLDSCGFCLQNLEKQSLAELQHTIQTAFPDDSVSDVVFWYPREERERRRYVQDEGSIDIRPIARVAGVPQVEMDFGGFGDVESILVGKNLVSDEDAILDTNHLAAKLQQGHRFAVVNVALPSTKNIALMATRYQTAQSTFPSAVPNARSRWYTFPKLTPNEVLLFYQYDRLVQQPSDVWHCVLEKESREEGKLNKNSFDLQCLLVFDEKVSSKQDRFGSDRIRQLRGPWE